MADKYWWEAYDRQKKDQQANSPNANEQKKSGYWWEGGASSSAVSDNITGRLNSWLQKHNQYVSDYQNRYSGRKYSYEDAYVHDAADWLRKAGEQNVGFDKEADSILAYMGQNSSLLDSKWMEQVKSILTAAKNQQSSIYDAAFQDNNWWGSFQSEEDYNAYQQDTGWRQKYTGKSYSDLQGVLGAMESSDEKTWLESYAPTVMTADDYQSEIEKNTSQIQVLEKVLKDAKMIRNSMGMGGEEADARAMERMKTVLKGAGYRSIEELEAGIEKLRAQNWQYDKSLQYGDLDSKADFAEKSAAATDKMTAGFGLAFGDLWLGAGDPIYDYINNLENYRTKTQEAAEQSSDARDPYHRYSLMTQKEIDSYNYLYNTQGKAAANDYLDYLQYELNQREKGAVQTSAAQFADRLPGTASAFSIPANLVSGIGALNILGQNIVKDVAEAVTGQYYKPIDYNAPATNLNTTTTTIRGTVAKNIADSTGVIQFDEQAHPVLSKLLNGKSLADVYQLGMSMVDSAAVALLSPVLGSAGTALLGGSAATQGILDAAAKGATDEQALVMGLLSGGFEMLFEKYELENLLGADTNMLKAIANQALTEGLGEGFTSVANTLADVFVMAENSEWEANIQAYMDKGLSREAAAKQAFLDAAVQVGWDFVGGVAMGGIMGSAGSAVNKNLQSQQTKKDYGAYQQELVAEALEIDPENAYAQKLQKYLDSGKQLSGSQLNRIVQQNEAALTAQDMSSIQSAAEARLTELGETGDVTAVAAALTKQAAGEKLSRAERQAISNSKYGQRVANELNTENIRSGEYSSEWAEKLDTNRINPEEYSRLVEDAQLPQETAEASGDQVVAETPNTAQVQQTELVENPAATADKNATVEQPPETTVANNQQMAGKLTGKESLQATEESSIAEETAHEPVTLESAAEKYGAQAKAMIHTYQAGQDVAKYDKAYQAAYDMGRSGVSFDYAKSSPTVSYLTDTQKELAYEAGSAASKMEAQELEAKHKAAANGKTGRKKGVVRGEGVTIADLKKTFNDTQGKAYKYLSTVAEVTGIDIVLYRSEAGPDGKFQGAQGRYRRSEPGTLYIDLNAGLRDLGDAEKLNRYFMLRTFAHEFTHFIENWNPVQYNAFRKVVFDTLTQRGENVQDLIEEKQARNPGMGYDKASREVVAEALTDILPDANFVQALAQKHKNIFTKLLEKLKAFVENLRSYYKNIGGSYDRGAIALKEQVGDTVKYLDNIVQLFDKAAVQAVENYQQTVATEEKVQEDKDNGRREETREAFDRRTSEEVFTVGQKGSLAYAYRPYLGSPSQNAQAAKERLEKIGVPVIIYERLEGNKDGVTTIYHNDATTIPSVAVFIHKDATIDALEIVGHEGFHFFAATEDRASYISVLTDNIDFASSEFISYQEKYIQEQYFEKKVEVDSEGSSLLAEEIFAYITGDINNSDPNGEVHAFLRDYDAVKTAWDNLIQKQTGTTEETAISQPEMEAAAEKKAPAAVAKSAAAEEEEAIPPKAETEEAKQALRKAVRMPIQGTNAEALLAGIQSKELSMDTVTLSGSVEGFNAEQREYLVRELLDGVYTESDTIQINVPYDGKFEISNTPGNIAKVLENLKVKVKQEVLFDKKTFSLLTSHGDMRIVKMNGASFLTNSYVMLPAEDAAVAYVKKEHKAKEQALHVEVEKAIQKATNPLTDAPTEAKLGKTPVLMFEADGKTLYFDKRFFAPLDGGTLYYAEVGGAAILKSVDESGNVLGYLMGIKPGDASKITDRKPSKLESFRKKATLDRATDKPKTESQKKPADKEKAVKTVKHETVENSVKPDDVQYQSRSYLSNEAEAFRNDINDWDSNGRPAGETFILGSTGDVLQGLGAIESDVYVQGDKINTIFQEHPEMTTKEIKNIPEILENPVMVLASRNMNRGTRANTRLTIFGMVKAQNGLPVMVAFDLHPVENKLYLSDMQKVVSAYTKDSSPTAAMKLMQNSDVLYADKEKTASLLHAVGFHNAYRIEQSGYIGNISYENDAVKITGKQFNKIILEEAQYDRGETVKPDDVQYQSREYLEEEYVHKETAGNNSQETAPGLAGQQDPGGRGSNPQASAGTGSKVSWESIGEEKQRQITEQLDLYTFVSEEAEMLLSKPGKSREEALQDMAQAFYEAMQGNRVLLENDWRFRWLGDEIGLFTGDVERILDGTFAVEEDEFQERSDSLTDREVLAEAADLVSTADLTDAEKDALDIFQKRLSKLEALQTERAEQGRLYKEQQFGAKVDRNAAAQTLNRMHTLDEQIKKASADVLSVEEKAVLKRVLQKARTVVEQQERQHGQEILKRWRDRRNNSDAIKKYRARIKSDVDELTNWVLHPDNKNVVKHIPDALKNTVIPFLSSINFMSKRSLGGGNHTAADKAFMEQLRRLEKVMDGTAEVDEMYANYTDLPPDFMKNLHRFIDTAQGIVDSNSGDFIINQMTSDELQELSKVVRTLKKYIMQMNRFHVNAMFQHVYEAGENSIDFMGQLKPAENTGAVSQFLLWQQMRPAYAFERFGEGGQAIYDGLRRGQATLAFNTKKIQAFAEKAYTTAEVKAWENQVKTIRIGPDKVVKMRVSQIMSLYELNKRKQAQGHILGEGIRVATFKHGKQKISDVGQRLTPGELNLILRELTPRQKEVADQLQQFMEKQGGEWGNYVTVARFGEKQFGEENYFPINSDGRHLSVDADEKPGAAALYALLNMGFTKQIQEKAKNRIVVYSIFDVFANHMASMAQYNAFALPVVDALKWFNYQRVFIDENGSKTILGSVREQMDRAFGVPEENRPGSGRRGYAQNFIINIIKALNGTEAQGAPLDTWGLKGLHRYNRAQVAYNFRVVVQQPLAITRAAMLLDYTSILKGMKLAPAAIQRNIKEMQSCSGIAAWKSLGFYDVNISRGLTSIIKHDDTALDKISDVGMWGAEKADLWTWAAIWSAAKEEVIRKQKLTPKSEGFYEAVTKLFEDVIYKTQVVDSVLTKNEFMRDKGFWARAVGSFMSEPTTTASMLLDAYDKYHMDLQRGMNRQQAWKKNQHKIVRTAYVYGLSAVILAAVQAAADALRDDDDYQEFYEKWLEAFGGNLVDELVPLNKLPIVSDFYELAKELLSIMGVDTYGNAPQSVFMQWYDSLVKGWEILHDKKNGESTSYTWYGGAYKLLQAASGITGLPMAAATREIVTAWNNIVGAMAPSLKVKTYEPSEKSQIKYAYQDGYLTEEEAIAQLIEQGIAENEQQARKIMAKW